MDSAIKYSKSYLKQRSKENTDILKKKLKETLSKSSLIVENRHIRKASGKNLRKKNGLYKNIDHIKREVIQSGGTITETQVTEKFINFKQKKQSSERYSQINNHNIEKRKNTWTAQEGIEAIEEEKEN